MPGSLSIPNNIGAQPGPQVQASLFDGNWTAIASYVNLREVTLGLLSARPSTPTAGAWYFATDTGALFAGNGTTWVTVATPSSGVVEQLTGLGLTWTSGTAITVAVGAATSDDAVLLSRVTMSNLSTIQGNTAGTWVVGNNQNKLDAGAIGASQSWHVFLIERVDTGVVDILFSLSPTAPTLPTNYTKQRRIGSFTTDGANAIVAFVQDGDEFILSGATLPAIYTATNPGTAAVLATLPGIPTGVKFGAIFNFTMHPATTANIAAYLSSPDAADAAPSLTASPLSGFNASADAAVTDSAEYVARIRTNVSAQIRYRLSASGAADVVRVQALGWVDRRGRG
jgi:hypothetical protein